ncbi:hypothetical protein CIC12_19865 [Burkholderia sp. SG-MS1]|nr:hypothetical protein [Paraburkholderia sp. SG-MS1]
MFVQDASARVNAPILTHRSGARFKLAFRAGKGRLAPRSLPGYTANFFLHGYNLSVRSGACAPHHLPLASAGRLQGESHRVLVWFVEQPRQCFTFWFAVSV